jgi:uncharacterized protein YjbI with pentapeptide repeats
VYNGYQLKGEQEERQMSEQQTGTGEKWGDPISEERQAELQGYLDRWEVEIDHGERKGPFDTEPGKSGVWLTGADVSWLAEQVANLHVEGDILDWPPLTLEEATLSDAHLEGATLDNAHLKDASLNEAHLEGASLRDAHLEGARLRGAHLEGANLEKAHLMRADLGGANLTGAYLEGADLGAVNFTGAHLSKAHLEKTSLLLADLEWADLTYAHLEGAALSAAHLEKATILGAHLEGADLTNAFLEGADFSDVHLERADFSGAHLEKVYLNGAHLEEAALSGAYLEKAYLIGAHLEGADLTLAHLEGANLTRASFDKASRLNDVVLTDASLDQVIFDQVNLTVVDLSLVDILGDERTAHTLKDEDGHPKARERRLSEFKAAVRANRVLAVALQAQGLSEDANRFAYRAQVLQRQLLRRQRKLGAYLFSVLLAVLAGYGYRLGRILIAYSLALVLFATAYFATGMWLGGTHLEWYEALLVSLTAIHGRVFITTFGLDSMQSWVAAVESVVGIVIEGVFVAMLIQRFFGR